MYPISRIKRAAKSSRVGVRGAGISSRTDTAGRPGVRTAPTADCDHPTSRRHVASFSVVILDCSFNLADSLAAWRHFRGGIADVTSMIRD